MGTEPPSPDRAAARRSAASISTRPTPAAAVTERDRPISILLIDDDRDDYHLTRDIVAEIPGGRFQLDWASSYEAGLAALVEGRHDVYLLDYLLGPRTGIELLHEANAHGRTGPVILLTGQSRQRTDLDALEEGADDYLEKAGLTASLLERAIRYAIAQRSASIELERKVQERTEELKRANEALRDASRRKDEFLSTLGHELRNPLAPILNALEIMRLAGNRIDTIERQRERWNDRSPKWCGWLMICWMCPASPRACCG